MSFGLPALTRPSRRVLPPMPRQAREEGIVYRVVDLGLREGRIQSAERAVPTHLRSRLLTLP
jgi:hypothetical protein